MKVRINHAIEIDEIPKKLSEMVSDVKSEIENAKKAANQAEAIAHLSKDSVLKYELLTESLSELKAMVTESSQSIEDLISMLGGYIGILDPKPEPAAPLPVAESPARGFENDPDLKGPDVVRHNKDTEVDS